MLRGLLGCGASWLVCVAICLAAAPPVHRAFGPCPHNILPVPTMLVWTESKEFNKEQISLDVLLEGSSPSVCCPSACLSMCSICLLSICASLSIGLFVHLPVIHLPLCPSACYPSACLFIGLFVHQLVCPSACLSIGFSEVRSANYFTCVV